jgi:hypothetical protein
VVRLSKGDPEAPLRLLAIKHGFGHSVDLQLVTSESAASYCAKYVSKSASDRDRLPWLDRATGEVVTGCRRYRTWTASRRWGLTMLALKRAQAAWFLEAAAGEPAQGANAPEPITGGATGTAKPSPLDPRIPSYTAGGVP